MVMETSQDFHRSGADDRPGRDKPAGDRRSGPRRRGAGLYAEVKPPVESRALARDALKDSG